jgi:hypothetical protein
VRLLEINVVRSPYAEELRTEGALEVLLHLIKNRFGPLSEHTLQKLSAVQERERLYELATELCRSATLDDLLKKLDE